jgi:3-dehydroquinate synthetase
MSAVDLHREVLAKLGLPTELPRRFDVDAILETMRFNKKYLVEGTRMALVERPGELWKVDDEYAIPVDDTVIARAIEATYEVES